MCSHLEHGDLVGMHPGLDQGGDRVNHLAGCVAAADLAADEQTRVAARDQLDAQRLRPGHGAGMLSTDSAWPTT